MTSDATPAGQRNWFWNLPYLAVGLFAVVMLVLVWGLQKRESDLQNDALGRDVRWAEQTMRLHMQGAQDFLVQLSRDLAEGTLDRSAFQVRATQYIANNPELSSIVWVDAGNIIRWTAPFETTEWIAGEALAGAQPVLFMRAHESGRPTYGEAYVSPRGTAIVELYAPVQRGRGHLGAIVGVYSVEGMLRHLVPGWFADKYRLSILGSGGGVLAVNSTVTPADESISYAISLDPPGNGLQLRAVAFRTDSGLARLVPPLLIVGLTLVVVWSLWTLRVHFRRRVQAEEELRAAYAFRKAMGESLVTGIRAVDLEGRIIFVNPAFCRMTGWSEQELVGLLPPFPYWPPEEAESLQRAIDATLAGQSPPGGFEMRIMHREGRRLDVRMYISPLIDSSGRQIGWMASMNDISDLKRMEEATLQHQKRLEQTSRLITMGEMASSLAHELNQPLSAIANYCMGSVNRLASGEFRHDEILTAMQKASAQAERAGKIIRRMREFVKKSEPNRARVDLAEIVDEAVGFAEIEARKAGVALRVDIPADLPPVFADRIMIEQVVLNLIKNGIEAMQQTPPAERELLVAARTEGERTVELAVADRGQGIDAEKAEQLFAPFYTTKPEGMGMGLNICRSIIEYHDGRLWAQPNPGGGSVFRFTLPQGVEK